MQNHWDVIVVGARCAGATLAATLARTGVRVLVLDADERGTDMSMSTHYMQPAGMVALDRLGVGERVRAVSPKTERFRLALDEAESCSFQERPGYCVRRRTLDPWLQDAAESAGAELRFRHKVVELVRSGDRVTGVTVQTPAGRERLYADLVVGADGAHSTIAKLTDAPEYLTEEWTRGGYWAYYPAPATWSAAWDASFEHRGDEVRYVFRADGDLLVMTMVTTRAEAESWGKSYREKLAQAFLRSPTTGPLSRGVQPVGKVMGLLRTRFFYRKPIGAGYALVGDAGHFKDFVTGQGMTDALLDGERLAHAIVSPAREQALEHFWHARDVATLPLHFDALTQGRLGYNNPFTRWVISHVGASPELRTRIPLMLERKIDPDELVPMATMLRWMSAALLRGRFDVLRGFMAVGKSRAGEQRELATRKALLHVAAEQLTLAQQQPQTRAPNIVERARQSA
jgi:menaquinone-9 beta-reductase